MRLETGTTGTPAIQLIRGTATDGNLDYYSKIIEFGTKFLDIIRK
jgi:hypothetical protein